MMATNPRKFMRFFSEQYHHNYGYTNGENDKFDNIQMASKTNRAFYRQLSPKTEQKIEQIKIDLQHLCEIFEKPRFTPISSVQDEQLSDESVDNTNSIISPSSSSHTTIETGLTCHRDMKTGSQRFRWNLLFNLLLWLIVPLPFWIPFVSNKVAYYLLPSIQAVFVTMWMIIGILALKNAIILYKKRSFDFKKSYIGMESKPIRHIVAISCYKEPVELISQSVQTLADQTEVNRITMVISFEERTPNSEEKCRLLKKQFENCGFERLIFTIHPFGLPNEIPGKCSNANYGLRKAIQEMDIIDNDTDHILITTCDADSKFPPKYISALTYQYLKENCPSLTTIYQSPLFYNWKLDSLSCITRVTGLLRSFLMLGALIPFNINTMSIFSFSLSLVKQGNFIHPAYQMDDIICLIRWMGITQKRLKISMIPVPVLSGPTNGETIEKEIIEWARQARRWTIGAAEVFHYFIIKSNRIPKRAAFSWGIVFIIYYGILLCTAGLYGLTSMLSMFLLIKNVPLYINYIMYGLLAAQMFTFLIAFIIDRFIPRLLKVEECICLLRNAYHFISTPFVLLAYSFVEFYALHELIIFGKKVCKHGASAKTALH